MAFIWGAVAGAMLTLAGVLIDKQIKKSWNNAIETELGKRTCSLCVHYNWASSKCTHNLGTGSYAFGCIKWKERDD